MGVETYGLGGWGQVGRFGVSLFLPPVSPMGSDTAKQAIRPPALAPCGRVALRRICGLVASDRHLGALARAIHQTTRGKSRGTCHVLGRRALPCIAPYNIFSCHGDSDLAKPSNLVIISVSRLSSHRRTRGLGERLFSSHLLHPMLTFADPNKHKMGTFVPCSLTHVPSAERGASRGVR